MCFSIPYKVLKTFGNSAIIEGGKTVTLGKDMTVKKGEYLQIVGNVAISKLSKREGLKIRQLISSLN